MTAREIPYHVVDVFAERALAGNPLAVVPDADALDADLMRHIAQEFNLSETTFLTRPTLPGADHRLVSFTAAGIEVSAVGHNGLGAWWWLAEAGRLGPLSDGVRATQESSGERLAVAILARSGTLELVGLTQGPPAARARHEDRPALAAALGLNAGDLAPETPQVVSTGGPHLLVEAIDRAVVDRARPNADALLRELAGVKAEGCYLYTRAVGTPAATAYARFFNPTVGIVEDPATGSAAGPLAWHLRQRGLVPADSDVTLEQGHRLGRPSRITVRVEGDRVEIRGRCVTVASGILCV